jgi:hypothetical protein
MHAEARACRGDDGATRLLRADALRESENDRRLALGYSLSNRLTVQPFDGGAVVASIQREA